MYNIGYNDDQTRNFQTWDQPKRAPGSAEDRLWVEISDDEDNLCLERPLFQNEAGKKSHHTPPLDMSLGKVGRHVDSPLDLSVKTRKRCADSTEFDDQHFAHAQLSKRMCVTPSGECKLVNVQTGDRRRSVQENVLKQKLALPDNNKSITPQMTYHRTIQSPKDEPSPLPYPQQHPFSSVRSQNQQSSMSEQMRRKQLPQAARSKLPAQLPQPIPQLSQVEQYQQQLVLQPTMLKPQNYDQYPIHASRSRNTLSKASLISETTALQGFYEPSHKHTLTVRGNVLTNDLGSTVDKDANLESRIAVSRIGSDVYNKSIVPERLMSERIAADAQRSAQTVLPSATHLTESRARQVGHSMRSYGQQQMDNILPPHQSQQLLQQQQQQHVRQQMLIHAKSDMESANQIIENARVSSLAPMMNSQKEPLLNELNEHEREQMAQVMKQYQRTSRGSQLLSYQTQSPPQQPPQQPPLQQQSLPPKQHAFHSGVQGTQKYSRNHQHYETVRDIKQTQLHQLKVPRMDMSLPSNMMDTRTKHDKRLGYGYGYTAPGGDYSPSYHQSSSNAGSVPRGYNRELVNPRHSASAYSMGVKVASLDRQMSAETVHIPTDYVGANIVNSHASRIPGDGRRVNTEDSKPKAQSQHFVPHSSSSSGRNINRPRDSAPITIENLLSEQTNTGSILGKSAPVGYSVESKQRSSRIGIEHRTDRIDTRLLASQFKANMDMKPSPDGRLHPGYQYPNQSRTDVASSRQTMPSRSQQASSRSSGGKTENNSTEGKRPMSNSLFSAMSGKPKPNLEQGRSIVAGTSGPKRLSLAPFDAFVLDVLRKDSDDGESVFKNKSVLQAFDRSANPSPSLVPDQESEKNNLLEENPLNNVKSTSVDTTSSGKSETYVLPIQIAIPGSIPAQRDSVIMTALHEQGSNRNPKAWSRKHMILSAYKQDKDLNNSVNIDENEKIPIVSSKFVSKRTEKDTSLVNPPSPKMPILSPEEHKRHTPLASPASRDPPTLENTTTNSTRPVSKSAKEISLEEQLHKIISDAVKGQRSFDKDSVCESVYREFASQPPGHKPFLSRQTSQSKHIPVANVAPMVHTRLANDNKSPPVGDVNAETREEDIDVESKLNALGIEERKDTLDEEVSTVAMKDTGDKTADHIQTSTEGKETVRKTFDIYKAIDIAMEEELDSDFRDEHTGSVEQKTGMPLTTPADRFAEDEVCGKQSLESHTQNYQVSLGDGNNNDKLGVSGACSSGIIACRRYSRTEHKDTENDRNVFGAFNEMLAQRRVSLEHRETTSAETEDHSSHVQYSKDVLAGYEGDDEDKAEKQTVKKRQSSVRQKADKLIRKAKQKKSQTSDGGESPYIVPQNGSPSHESQVKEKQRRRSRSNSKSLQCSPKDQSVSDSEVFKNDESTDEEYFQNYEDEFKQFLKKQNTDKSLNKKPVVARKKKGLQFQLKYFSQRKKKAKGKKPRLPASSSLPSLVPSTTAALNQLYDFEDDDFTLIRPASMSPPEGAVLDYQHGVPIPPDLKRLAVNKDTGETLLHKAARMGYEEVVLYCLTTESVDVNVRDNAGYTPLHECAVAGRVPIARHLLSHGADVNVCSVDGIRPIHDAVEYDRLEMLRLLLSFGADPTLSTYAGKTLLKIARTDRMRRFLTYYNADLNGSTSESEASVPWQFPLSTKGIETEAGPGCAIFSGLPSDPEDETNDLCVLSVKPLFPTQRITADGGKRVEDYILLDDIVKGYKLTRSEVEDHIPSLMLKTIGKDTFLESKKNSVFLEKYNAYASSLVEDSVFSAIRHVDSAQIISKIEKLAFASKRSKM